MRLPLAPTWLNLAQLGSNFAPTWLQLRPNLAPTWLNLAQLGSNLAPTWPQLGSTLHSSMPVRVSPACTPSIGTSTPLGHLNRVPARKHFGCDPIVENKEATLLASAALTDSIGPKFAPTRPQHGSTWLYLAPTPQLVPTWFN